MIRHSHLGPGENAENERLFKTWLAAEDQYRQLIPPWPRVDSGEEPTTGELPGHYEALKAADERKRAARQALNKYRREHGLPTFGND